ncbi:hypothetical protein ACIOV9_12755 [Pseudomonas iridis]|uniref:hypothetical protein n=1 Tax=Pseudomonas iridis TaxID=2710587 RepID=UPI003828FB8E
MKIELALFDEAVKSLIRFLPSQKKYLQSLEVDYSLLDKEVNPHRYSLSYLSDVGERTLIIATSMSFPDPKWCALDFARYAFLYLVAKKLSYKDLAHYFYDSLSSVYRVSSFEDKSDHILIRYSSMEFDPESGIFAVSLHENVLIFFPDNFDVEGFRYKSDVVGNVTLFCKTNPSAFNIENLVLSLSMSPMFAHSDSIYRKALRIRKVATIFGIVDLLSPGEDSAPYLLKKRLSEVPASDGLAFELVCEDILRYVFSEVYDDLKIRKQIPTYNGTRRRDFIIDNLNPSHPLLVDMKQSGVKYLLFDAKNYEEPMSTSDLDTFFSYIQEQPKFGKFGIIISRKGVKENAKIHIFHRMLSQHDEIIVLNENDLVRLIDLAATARDPMTLIEEKITSLRLQR